MLLNPKEQTKLPSIFQVLWPFPVLSQLITVIGKSKQREETQQPSINRQLSPLVVTDLITELALQTTKSWRFLLPKEQISRKNKFQN